MEDRLQHQPATLEPQRPHTDRVRSAPHGRAEAEQILLMADGQSGEQVTTKAPRKEKFPMSSEESFSIL